MGDFNKISTLNKINHKNKIFITDKFKGFCLKNKTGRTSLLSLQ